MSERIKVGLPAVILGTIVNYHGAHLEPAFQTVALRAGLDGQALVTNVGNIIPVPEIPNGMSLERLLDAIAVGEVLILEAGKIAKLGDSLESLVPLATLVPIEGEELELVQGRGVGINIDHERVENAVREILGRDMIQEEREILLESLKPPIDEEEILPTGDEVPAFKLPGVSKAAMDELKEKGLDSYEALRNATDAELLAIDGIGEFVLARIRKFLAESAEASQP